MKRIADICAVVVISLSMMFVAISTYAVSNKKDEYELQERCSKQAESYFKRNYGGYWKDTPTGWATIEYAYHYNRKMNRCFILVTEKYHIVKEKARQIFGDEDAEDSVQNFKNLYDVMEGTHYANFYARTMLEEPEELFYPRDLLKKPLSCMVMVLGKYCKSEEEWDSFVRPYMEE